MYFYLASVVIAVIGLFISILVRYKKSGSTEVMVEPSRYLHFFGVPVDVLGIIYYGWMAVCYTSIILLPSLANPLFFLIALAASVMGLMFSIYLIFVQAFSFGKWCYWCFGSAVASIFMMLSIFGEVSNLDIMALLADYKKGVVTLHLIGFALGLGGASVTDFLFFKFLKDFQVSRLEDEVLHYLSQIIWFGLAILIVSGIGLYLPSQEALNQTPKFLAKVIIVGVVLLNGIALNLAIAPRMASVAFRKSELNKKHLFRRISFALGAVSIVSWYSAFLLAVLPRSTPLSLPIILLIYAVILTGAVFASQHVEKTLEKETNID